MADVTLTIALSDIEAHALAIVAASVEHDNPCVVERCVPAQNPARLSALEDGRRGEAVINRVGNPTVLSALNLGKAPG